MDYLTDGDFKHRIQWNDLLMILDGNTALLDEAESTAKAVILDVLHTRYDTAAIFSKVAAARDAQVIRWMINLVLYYVYERIPDSLVPDRVVKNYDDTMFYLLEIADGKKSTALDRLEDPEGKAISKFKWGSQTRRTH